LRFRSTASAKRITPAGAIQHDLETRQLSWLFIVDETGKKGYPLAGIFCAKTIWFVDMAIGASPN
jgi:hypothetical protein